MLPVYALLHKIYFELINRIIKYMYVYRSIIFLLWELRIRHQVKYLYNSIYTLTVFRQFYVPMF